MKVNEIYPSIQGEGPRVGVPTIFARFAMCNMKCPLWPCDTQHAIDPKLYRDDPVMDPQGVYDIIQKISGDTGAKNVCLTGGEPFIQKHRELEELVMKLIGRDWSEPDYTVECFSNGSFVYPQWALDTINFVLDWKLAGSGESQTRRDDRLANVKRLKGGSVKFTVSDRNDLHEAKTVYEDLQLHDPQVDYWVGIVWNKEVTNEEVVDFILTYRLPWNLTMQVHKHIWDPNKRAI